MLSCCVLLLHVSVALCCVDVCYVLRCCAALCGVVFFFRCLRFLHASEALCCDDVCVVVSCCVLLCCDVLCSVAFHCCMRRLRCAVLNYVVLNRVALCCVVLCCAALYYVLLCSAVACIGCVELC